MTTPDQSARFPTAQDRDADHLRPASRLSRRAMMLGAATALCLPGQARAETSLAGWIASPHRGDRNRARDAWRRPAETIGFLGVEPRHTVVEILPGSGGYWLEFLAPYLRDKGLYVAANRDEAAAPAYLADHQKLLAKLAADPAHYDKVVVTKFHAGEHRIAPDATADFVLTFRNLHNWLDRDEIGGALNVFRQALKPGAILGVEDHRGRTDLSQEAQMRTGYVREDFVIALMEKNGFRHVASSNVLANPKDTKDHPNGVWSLPPTLRGGETDRAKYVAIGESDRFLMKFAKA